MAHFGASPIVAHAFATIVVRESYLGVDHCDMPAEGNDAKMQDVCDHRIDLRRRFGDFGFVGAGLAMAPLNTAGIRHRDILTATSSWYRHSLLHK